MEIVSKETNKVMLLKLPDYLYQTFLSNSDLAASIKFDPKTYQLEVDLPKSVESSSYGVLTFKSKIEPIDEGDLSVFTVDQQRKATLKSQVAYKGNLLPERNEHYIKLIQKQSEQVSDFSITTAEPRRDDNKIQPRIFSLHEDHKYFVMANPEQARESSIRKMHKEKRVREDPEKVKAMLFDLFSTQRFWKLKTLAEHTSQPESYLADILREIGEKGPPGQYKSQWQLKSEFRGADEGEEGGPTKKPKIV
mmetsp:Transcript_32610/g.32324  ORF Transcript_32610/g.32324 Transcript_32610/m.32324 type:complete len:250 (-) Transcript_32610:31-780(-)